MYYYVVCILRVYLLLVVFINMYIYYLLLFIIYNVIVNKLVLFYLIFNVLNIFICIVEFVYFYL